MNDSENMKRIEKELRAIDRPGMENLLDCMEDGGFYTSPCSGSHHLAEDGGLAKHSLNVLDYARKLNKVWGNKIKDETIVVTALLHDLGKMGDHGKPNYVEKILKSGERSKATPFETNKDLVYVAHEIRSIWIAERYIALSEEEEQAILWHNGLYSIFKYDIPGKETELYLLLHTADMYVSRFVEIEETEKEEKG